MKALKPGIILLIVLLFFNLSANSQDLIVRINGTRTEAKILEVDYQSVSYYKISDPEKTVFNLLQIYVDKLIYEDGKIIDFENSSSGLDSDSAPLKKNILQTNVLGLLMDGNINLTYERLLGTGSFSFFGEMAVGLKPEVFLVDESKFLSPIDYSSNSFFNMPMRSAFYIQSGFLFNIRKGIFRFGTGFSFQVIVYKTENYEYVQMPDKGHTTYKAPVFTIRGEAKITEKYQIHTSYDIPFNSYIGTVLHIGVSYSF